MTNTRSPSTALLPSCAGCWPSPRPRTSWSSSTRARCSPRCRRCSATCTPTSRPCSGRSTPTASRSPPGSSPPRRSATGSGGDGSSTSAWRCSRWPRPPARSPRTPTVLVVARTVQGIGAAAVLPLSLTILTTAFPPQRRGMIVGIYGGLAGLAVASGPIVGGVVTEGLGWHWIFWLNVPIGLVATALATRPASGESRRTGTARPGRRRAGHRRRRRLGLGPRAGQRRRLVERGDHRHPGGRWRTAAGVRLVGATRA